MFVHYLFNGIILHSDIHIQIMPSTNKARAVFDSMKTTSYHIKSVVACTQSAKSSSSFKFVVMRDNGEKRYDFEAEDNKLAGAHLCIRIVHWMTVLIIERRFTGHAAEIVTCIRHLKNTVDRPGTANKSRRSRHVS